MSKLTFFIALTKQMAIREFPLTVTKLCSIAKSLQSVLPQISSRWTSVLHADGIFCAAGTQGRLISEGDREEGKLSFQIKHIRQQNVARYMIGEDVKKVL